MSPDAPAQARAEAAPELGGLKGAAPRLLHFARSTPLVAATLVGHKQAVRAQGLPEGLRISILAGSCPCDPESACLWDFRLSTVSCEFACRFKV